MSRQKTLAKRICYQCKNEYQRCYIHAFEEDCRGKLQNALSIYGAAITCCKAAFDTLDPNLWTLDTPKEKE